MNRAKGSQIGRDSPPNFVYLRHLTLPLIPRKNPNPKWKYWSWWSKRIWRSPTLQRSKGNFNWKYGPDNPKVYSALQWYLHLWWPCFNLSYIISHSKLLQSLIPLSLCSSLLPHLRSKCIPKKYRQPLFCCYLSLPCRYEKSLAFQGNISSPSQAAWQGLE